MEKRKGRDREVLLLMMRMMTHFRSNITMVMRDNQTIGKSVKQSFHNSLRCLCFKVEIKPSLNLPSSI